MRRCVFLDRDGVINRAARPGEYIRRWDEFHLMPGIVDWIRLFRSLDLLVIVVTNQRGVALGVMTAADLEHIHENMRALLAQHGAPVDDVFSCIHAEGTCDCRKPRPGMVLEAARKWNIDLGQSLLLGDSARDRDLAVRCGLRFVAVCDGQVADLVYEESPVGGSR